MMLAVGDAEGVRDAVDVDVKDGEGVRETRRSAGSLPMLRTAPHVSGDASVRRYVQLLAGLRAAERSLTGPTGSHTKVTTDERVVLGGTAPVPAAGHGSPRVKICAE